MHNDECPEIRAIYKIVSTEANVAKYQQYLSVSLTVPDSLTLITMVLTTTVNGSKPEATSSRRVDLLETRTAGGTERRGSVILETKDRRGSARTLLVSCAAS